MVMDATQSQQPSPQSVGREFVRQYYTLLNKAPNHLHRFYNNNSSFIHGESTLVVGQKNIHNRIQQLNFHDCHAKISQVDAQATLGNGVVVQVTGELSNDGQPMRRFTQTFVLAAQSPKKYYVHNDIFRYQDLYSDEEIDGEARSENDDDHEQLQQVAQTQVGQAIVATVPTAVVQINEQQASVVGGVNEQALPNQIVANTNAGAGVLNQQAQTVYYPMPAAGGRPLAVLPPPAGAAAVPLTANYTNAGTSTGVPPQAVSVSTASQLNGVVAHDELITNMQQTNVTQQPQLAPNQTTSPVLTQAGGSVSVNNGTVLSAQTPAGVANIPVALSASSAAGLPQNNQTAIPNYQQSHHMPAHMLQQQQAQQPPQQQLQNVSPQLQQQQTVLQQQSQSPLATSPNMAEVEDTVSSNQVVISSSSPSSVIEQQQLQSRPNTTANVVVSGQTVASSPATVLESTPPPVVEDFKTINEQQQQEKYEAAKQQQQQQNEPKTYANLFKSTSSSPSSFVNAAMQQQQQIQQQQQQTVNSIYQHTNSSSISASNNNYAQSTSATNSLSGYTNRNNENSNQIRQENNNNQSSGGPLPQRSNAKSFNKDFDQRRTSNPQQFGDSQQLFLGNIPHHASEDELKALFSRFGQIVDLRILSKGSGKLPPGARNPLNYGFITYNDAEAVQNCLANCPLYFPDSPDGQKLNVEEKKPRTRLNEMPPRQSMGGSGGNSGSGINNMSSNQRNMSGGPPSRSLSNSGNGSIMRGSSVGNNTTSMTRGGSSGGGSGGPPRMGGAFNRNDNRASNGGNSGGGSQMRGGNNSQSQAPQPSLQPPPTQQQAVTAATTSANVVARPTLNCYANTNTKVVANATPQ